MFLERINKLRLYKKAALVGAVLVLLTGLLKNSAWGLNHLFFLEKPLVLFIMAISGIFFYLGYVKGDRKHSKDDLEPEQVIANWQLFLLPIIASVLCLAFPIVSDVYGDAHSILNNYGRFYARDRSIGEAFLILIDPDIFNLHNGERFTFNFIFILRKIFGMDLEEAFRLYGALFCFGTAFIYSMYLKTARLGFRLPYILFFLSVNFLLIFSGHVEVYAPSIFFLSLFLLLAKRQYEHNKKVALVWLLLVLFFAIKAHFINFVLLAPFSVLVALQLKPTLVNFFTLRNVAVLFLSGVIGFFLAYFFIFKNHDSHYAEKGNELFGNVFLPLWAPAAPYNHYSLFNLNHLYDFLQLVLSWSPVLWFVVAIGLMKKDLIKSVSGFYLMPVLILFTYGFVAFVFNPILSMPRDWDILSLAGPGLLCLGTEIWSSFVRRIKVKLLYSVAAVFMLFTIPRTLVEFHEGWAGRRLLMVGDRVYKTYYAGSSVLISKSVKMLEKANADDLSNLADSWLEHSNTVPDTELGHALSQIGIYYAETRRKNYVALDFFTSALEAYPKYPIAMRGMAAALINTGDHLESLKLAQQLLRSDDQNKQHWYIAFDSLSGLKMFVELKDALSQYLELFPEDADFVNDKLKEIEEVEKDEANQPS